MYGFIPQRKRRTAERRQVTQLQVSAELSEKWRGQDLNL